MSIKNKLIIIGICVTIVIVVFAVNVVREIREDGPDKILEENVGDNIMTRAEAYRLLSYLYYDKKGREAIPKGITYADEKMSGWYDTYVNAAWNIGLIEGNITTTPTEALTYGTCKNMIDNLIIKNPEFQSVYENLSFGFTKAEEGMLIPDFLELYEAILAGISKEDQKLTKETLFVLGKEATEDKKDRMVTDQGNYYYLDAANYVQYSSQEETDGKELKAQNLVDQFLDKGIIAYVCGQEIVYVSSIATEKIVMHNVWIKQGEGNTIDSFVNGIDKSFITQYKLATSIGKVIGDITIENSKIVQISVKPDMIKGKVLRSGDDYIEVEGYGKLPLDEDYRIYKIYGTMTMEPTSSILVGYENTNFIVSGEKISAALITESIKAENIRVLLKTSGYKNIYHKKVKFTATEDFTVAYGDKKTSYRSGDEVLIEQGDRRLEEERITIKTVSGEGKIKILSVERSEGNPKYRGSIEISKGEKGLLLVNELPLEEYLYAVIPSEMPTNYGEEALKVQAVCARSYAYKHLLSNDLNQYGAHVDDSVSYQVYNNIAENEDSILAVKDTYGKVIKYEGDVIAAYYFSTSCGHTTGTSGAWSNDVDLPYLEGKLLLTEEEGEGDQPENDAANRYEDLSSEKSFRKFIEDKELVTYDASFNWYRWKVTMGVKDIQKVIDANLASRYQANPELILTKSGTSESEEEAYDSVPVETIGTIVDIKVLKRETSGIVSEILITGSEHTIKVKTEYNIRALLAPTYDKVTRLDESKVEDLNLLPSAFFVIDKKEKNNKLSSVTLTGGGFGHGVGLSQNGVKALADAGKGYEEIVTYFYNDTEIGFIY